MISQIVDKFKPFRTELVLIGCSVVLTIVSSVTFLVKPSESSVSPISINKNTDSKVGKISVEISGAVVKPGVYKVKSDSRLDELLKRSGGLSETADKDFFARNFNLSRFVADQEKIYIPSRAEVAAGLFIEKARAFELQSGSPAQSNSQSSAGKISINSASSSELDSLPGVGATTVKKIIDGRPYSSLEELTAKGILKQSVFDQVKDLISL